MYCMMKRNRTVQHYMIPKNGSSSRALTKGVSTYSSHFFVTFPNPFYRWPWHAGVAYPAFDHVRSAGPSAGVQDERCLQSILGGRFFAEMLVRNIDCTHSLDCLFIGVEDGWCIARGWGKNHVPSCLDRRAIWLSDSGLLVSTICTTEFRQRREGVGFGITQSVNTLLLLYCVYFYLFVVLTSLVGMHRTPSCVIVGGGLQATRGRRVHSSLPRVP